MEKSEYIIEGRFYSLAREGERFAALGVGTDGRIAQAYPEGAPLPAGLPRKNLPPGTAACVPAFIDTHTHFLSKAAVDALVKPLGRIEGSRFLPDCLDGVRVLLEEAAREKPRGAVVGYGLFPGALTERRLPRASELDAWVPGRPVIVLALDGHSSSYSTAALKALGLESAAQEGILSGEAHEFNMDRVMKFAMKELGLAQIARGISRSVRAALDSGLSAVHCLEGFGNAGFEPGTSILALAGPRLPVRVRLWLQYTKISRVQRYVRKLGNPRVGGCMLWEMDGSISSRSAGLDKPYRDRDHAGKLYRTAEEAYALCRPFQDAGYQISAHAIGPRGIESILSAYERLLAEAGDPRNERRHRIDHFELPRRDQIERAGRRCLVLPVQPGFAWMDARYLHSYPEALDAATLATFCPLRSLLEAGAVPTLSTDAPVQGFDPFIQIAGAVEHPDPGEALSVYQALRAYTWAGAYASFEEQDRGTLEVGKYADFAPLDRDPFETPAQDLHSIKPLGTWAEGRPLSPPPEDLLGFSASLARHPRRKI